MEIAMLLRRAVLSVLLMAGLGAGALAADTGAMFRGGAAHLGVYPGRAIGGAPVLRWKFQTGGKVVASPAVADGVAYVGSADGAFYAIDMAGGGLKWKFQ